MIRYMGVHHPAFVTNDLEKTVRFWRDLLKMRLVHTTGDPGERQAFFAMTERDFIAFFEWPDAEPVPFRRPGQPRGGACVFDHVAIRVGSEEDLWELLARLEAAGLPVSDVTDHGFARSVYSFDPNGIPLEFLYEKPNIRLWSHPILTGQDMPPAVLEGSHPRPGLWPEPEQIPPEDREVIPGSGHDDFK